MFVVEFLGIPGSGKSTLAALVASRLDGALSLHEAVRGAVASSGHDVMSRLAAKVGGKIWKASYARSPDPFAAMIRFASEHPGLVEVIAAAHCQKMDRGAQRDSSMGYMLNFLARYQLVTEAANPGVVVLDEGFAQRGIMLFAHDYDQCDTPLLDRYVAGIPCPDLIVSVSAPAETCRRRVHARGWTEGPLSVHSDSGMRFLTGAQQVADRITTQSEAEVFQVSGSGDAEKAAQYIVDYASLLTQGRDLI